MRYQKSIFWLRRDLRLDDNVALSAATSFSEEVVLVFVFDTNILGRLKDKNDRRINFIHHTLRELDQKLRKKGSALVVFHGDPKKEIPEFAKRMNANAVFANRDYEPYAKTRHKAIRNACNKLCIAFHDYKDQVIFEGNELLTQSELPYKVFTPYKNKWLMELNVGLYKDHRSRLKRLIPLKQLDREMTDWSLKKLGFDCADLCLKAGESAAKIQLKNFLSELPDYDKSRNYPALSNGTSRLSVHLRFGTLSIRSLVRFVNAHPSSGAQIWLSELIWRDFYQMILDQFPHIVRGCFKNKYDQVNGPAPKTISCFGVGE